MQREDQSKLNKLIQELCPKGVEYRTLGEVCSLITDGAHYSPRAVDEGYYMPSVKDMRSNGFDFSNCKQISEKDYFDLVKNGCRPEVGDLLVAKDGSMLKYAFTVKEKLDIVILSSIAIFRPNPDLITGDFLAHYLTRESLKESVIRDYSTVGGVPRIVLKNFKKVPIPVPPLPVQSEIVRILDAFTALTAELTAELTARRKQYEYYRDRLLKFDDLTGGVDCADYSESVSWVKLGNVCSISRGKVISKEYIRDNPGEYPVYSSQTNNNGELGRINTFDYQGEYLTWTTDGANAGSVFYRNGKFNITNVCGLLRVNDNIVLARFLYYILVVKAPQYVSEGMGNPKLMSNVMAQIPIPLPPLSEQRRIVSILDRFDALCNDLTQGLPAEIAARRKQYEFYRDRLLDFQRKE